MNLVIVESPTKAKTITKYLGKGYKVISSYGHIRDLPSKEGSVMPDEDFKMIYEINPKATKRVKEIVDDAKKVDELILASDPDREGEAIAWHIVETLKQKKALHKDTAIKRIVFHEITKKSIQNALTHPRQIDMDLVNAQQARRALDYLVGFKLSPVLWRKLPGSKSAGRVQSVALRLICEREDEIEKFKSEEYWTIDCILLTRKQESFLAKLTHINGKKLDKLDIKTADAVNPIVEELQKGNYQVLDVEKKTQKRNPFPPFITSTLQQEASRKLGFTAKKTMMLAQKLYEGIDIAGENIGLITYMRTDGTQISADFVNVTRNYIESNFGKDYLPAMPNVYKTKVRNAQEAHEAIRPTHIEYTPQKIKNYLDKDQYKLYELVWKRMLACQMSSAILDQVVARITDKTNKYELRAVGSAIKFDGFLKLYKETLDDEEEEENKLLPELIKGDQLALDKVNSEQHFTQPPPRYTEASLVKKMEELGIGRPSTYATIISVLQDRNYVILDKKRFIPEERGIVVTAFLKSFFAKYVEYDFTANLEDELDHVSEGKLEWKKLLQQFWQDFSLNIQDAGGKTVSDVLEQIEPLLDYHIFYQHNEPGVDPKKCPTCKTGKLGLKMGKFGPFIACSNYPECHYTRQLESNEKTQNNEVSMDDKEIAVDNKTGKKILLKNGPYGHYLQMGGDKEKDHKRVPIPSFINISDMNEELAQKLVSLPRKLGVNPTTGEEISVGIGRYGPYILSNKKFTSLKDPQKLFTLEINEAIQLMNVGGNKILGKVDNIDVEVCRGRYGPYIKFGSNNIKIPKKFDPDQLSLSEAKEIIENYHNK
jgi:DNA topoisomerase-1